MECKTKKIDNRCVDAIQDIMRKIVIEKDIYPTFVECSHVLALIYYDPLRPKFPLDNIPCVKKHYKKNSMNRGKLV